MTTEEYRSHPATHYSRLKWLLRSPAHYRNPPAVEEEKSPELVNGTILHAYALEGREVEYAVQPKFNPESGDESDTWHGAKKWVKAWKKAQTLPILDEDSVADQLGMREALKNDPVVQEILASCPERERAIFANYNGVDVKALLDMAGHDASGGRCIVDLKSVLDASPQGFSKAVGNRALCLQMALYSNALALAEELEQRPGWLWIAVENKRPYNVAIYTPTPEHWELGQKQLDHCITLLKYCRDKDHWPGYSSEIQTLPWRKWDEFQPQLSSTETE